MGPPETSKAPAWSADAPTHQIARAEPALHSADAACSQSRGAA